MSLMEFDVNRTVRHFQAKLYLTWQSSTLERLHALLRNWNFSSWAVTARKSQMISRLITKMKLRMSRGCCDLIILFFAFAFLFYWIIIEICHVYLWLSHVHVNGNLYWKFIVENINDLRHGKVISFYKVRIYEYLLKECVFRIQQKFLFRRVHIVRLFGKFRGGRFFDFKIPYLFYMKYSSSYCSYNAYWNSPYIFNLWEKFAQQYKLNIILILYCSNIQIPRYLIHKYVDHEFILKIVIVIFLFFTSWYFPLKILSILFIIRLVY